MIFDMCSTYRFFINNIEKQIKFSKKRKIIIYVLGRYHSILRNLKCILNGKKNTRKQIFPFSVIYFLNMIKNETVSVVSLRRHRTGQRQVSPFYPRNCIISEH